MIDPSAFKHAQQAYELGAKIVDLVKNHKADAALLGCLAAVAMLRRKTTLQLEDMLIRMRTIDSIIDMMKMVMPQKSPEGT